MKALGWLVGIAAFGGLIVLSIAGVTAAIAILLTAAAIVAMIALGSLLGGRTTPDRPPYVPDAPPDVPDAPPDVTDAPPPSPDDARGAQRAHRDREGPHPGGEPIGD